MERNVNNSHHLKDLFVWFILWFSPSITETSVELERPLSVQCAQSPELQRHGMRTGAGGVLVLQRVVVVVLDWSAVWVQCEGPEAVQMDLLAEASGHRVHEQTRGWTFDVNIVGQPIPVDRDIGPFKATEINMHMHLT